MPKTPETLPVKVTVSKITLEVPKSFFEHSALRAAIFVGRKGRSAATRRTKWFTLADPSLVPSRTRQSVVMPTASIGGSRHGSMILEGEAGGEQHRVEEVPVEMAVLEYSGMNSVVYEVDMKPLNIFDGDWVFDQKTTHPLSIFAKILVKNRPGVRIAAGAKSEQESNLGEMLQMDQDEMESGEDNSDKYSDDHGENSMHDDGAFETSLSGMNLTEAQLAALSGAENVHEMVMNQLRRGVDCKKRYLSFPKSIDVANIVNTKVKTADYCERLICKNAALLGTTLSFTLTAELPREKLEKLEDKIKSKECKEEIKHREQEEKALAKERKREEKQESKRRAKEEKKSGKKEKNYGADVTDVPDASGAKNEFKGVQSATVSQPQQPSTPDGAKKKISVFSPLSLVKGIFTKEEKPEKATPFSVKLTSTPYPFLVMLYDFELSKLVMDPVNYRAVHIRLGSDLASTDDFPRLLLDLTKQSAKSETTVTWYDGSTRDAVTFHFDAARIFFADKAIRHITGFETLRALQEHERQYHEAKRAAAANGSPHPPVSTDGALFREQLMNVGTKFHPIAFEPTKYSTNGNQALATKFTRVTAQLLVAENIVGEVRQSYAAEKEAYVRKLKKEQKQREKEEKERLKAEKAARKAEEKGEGEASVSGGASLSRDASHEVEETSTPVITSNSKDADSHVGNDAEGKANGADENDGGTHTFETGAADHLDATEEVDGAADSGKKKKREKDGSKIVLNRSNSFQLSTYVMNEDYMPEEGLQYRILFRTGEELTFRARRFFLPSVCVFGADGCTREKTLCDYLNSTGE